MCAILYKYLHLHLHLGNDLAEFNALFIFRISAVFDRVTSISVIQSKSSLKLNSFVSQNDTNITYNYKHRSQIKEIYNMVAEIHID